MSWVTQVMGQLSGGLHRSWVTIYDLLSALQNSIKRYGRNTNRKSYVFCPMAPFSIIIEHVLRSNQETIYIISPLKNYPSWNLCLWKPPPPPLSRMFPAREELSPVRFWPWRRFALSEWSESAAVCWTYRGLFPKYWFFRPQSHYNYFRASVE